MSDTPDRHFLDWKQPCLPQAAGWIVDRADTGGGLCRLDRTAVVTPGRQAGRVLLELLVRECGGRGLTLMPPRVLTPGSLIDVLLPPREPIADSTECALAWMNVLRSADAGEFAAWIARPPEETDLRGWYALAETLHRLWTELAAESRTFAEVADLAGRLELPEEAERWAVLDQLLARYRRTLRERGLADPDIHRAHLLQHRAASPGPEELRAVVLVGIAELTATQRLALARLADRTTALVHAPEDAAPGFDPFGAVDTEWWHAPTLPLERASIIFADRPEDQAQAAVRRLAVHVERTAEEITLGFGDAALADQLEQAADWTGLSLHRADGRELARTEPFRLLETIARWLEEPRFANFAALLRHPDLERMVARALGGDGRDESVTAEGRRDWLSLLDRYFADHLHERLSGEWLGDPARQRRLRRLYEAVHAWLRPLRASDQATRALGEWVAPTLEVLASVYESSGDDREIPRAASDACLAIRDALLPFTRADNALQPQCGAATALRLLLSAIESLSIPAPVRAEQIETLGWLELHLDPAPALIVTGVNDGAIPRAVGADAFLPDRLREKLGLMCNRRRFARDGYLLRAILESRGDVTLIVGRSSAEGEPLMPSRLLLTGSIEALPARIAALTDADRALRWARPLGAPAAGERSRFLVPAAPDQPVALESLPVTAFALYLQCPYRFWLQHVLSLRELADTLAELDPLAFGSMAHEVLRRFGRDDAVRESADVKVLREFLFETLRETAREWYGPAPMPAVRIQLARLERRLEAFAALQAAERAQGWRITECEYALPDAATLELSDQPPLHVRATIDRIDEHETTKMRRIIDYKTGESGATPFEVHHGRKSYKAGEWIDLQLPLYEHLYRAVTESAPDEVELGYIVLPRKAEDVALRPAGWTGAQLDEAIETAREVVRSIRAGRFELNADYRSRFDPFARICQTSVLGGAVHEDADESEGEDAA